MNNQSTNDEQTLARLIRQAGDPTVAPTLHHIETLRATILDRVATEQSPARVEDTAASPGGGAAITEKRNRTMLNLARLATAAAVLAAVGTVTLWGPVGAGLAFAQIAEALDGLRTATYDFTSELKNPVNNQTITIQSKGYFKAPGIERVEMETTFAPDQPPTRSVLILDCVAAKGLSLLPEQKKAIIINIAREKVSTGGTANMFEMVRRLVTEGKSDTGEEVERIGEKVIDGQTVIGFRTSNQMADITLWASPETARLVRVEFDMAADGGRQVMSNIRYDVELDPSLFSLEPPEGYEVQTQTIKEPTEEGLINLLRFVAEFNNDTFPDTIGMTEKTFLQATQAEVKAETAKLLQTPEVQERMKALKAEFGDDRGGFMKAWMKEWMERVKPITQERPQKRMMGVMFFASLQPVNDAHYAGKGVKLGEAESPIFWYQPTGADQYRVVYGDLTVKELSPDKAKGLTAPTIE